MPTSKEQLANRRKEANEDKEHVLHNLWSISPHSAFYGSFKRNMKFMSDMTMCCMLSDHEVIEDFKASESELREIRTLCFYSYYLFYQNKPMKRYSSIAKEECVEFQLNLRLWKRLKPHQRAALQRYLNSPIPEIAEPAVETPELEDPICSRTVPPFEHKQTGNMDEESSEESFKPVQEHISSQPMISNEEQPTLNSVFYQIMTGSNIEPHDKRVETSSENDLLECSSHSSNGEGGFT